MGRDEKRERALFEALQDVVVVHRDGEVVYANAAAVRALGKPMESLVGAKVSSLAHEADRAWLSAPDGDHAVRFLRKGGEPRTITVTALPLVFDGKEAVAVVGHDSTALAESQALLLRNDRLASLGTLATGVAQGINNPITYVMSHLEFLGRRLRAHAAAGDEPLAPDEVARLLESVGHAVEGIQRVRSVARDLTTFSSGNVVERSLVDVRSVLQSSIQMAWHEIRHRAKLVKKLGEVPPVEANEARLAQVFLSLLVNAAQAIPEGNAEHHSVSIATRATDEGQVVIEIADSGAGMAPDVTARVFDPFFTTKPKAPGGGLGLSIAHGIVRDLGGDITCQSEEGVGTKFTIVLPSARGFRSSGAMRIARDSREDRSRVLIIDDDRMVADAMALTVGDEADVTVVTGARDALELLARGERFDTILCDLMMPVMTGMDLYAEALRVAPDAVGSIVFVSGGAFTPRARAFLDGVGSRCLEKPIAAKDLRAAIRRRSNG
jgi:signal transduction histidine kinase